MLFSPQPRLRHFDWWLLGIVFLLISISVLLLYSLGLNRFEGNLHFFKRQVFFALIGFFILFLGASVDWRTYISWSKFFYFVGLALLIFVFLFGEKRRAVQGWLSIGGISFQPVEFAKIFFIFGFAYFLSKKSFVPHLKMFFQALFLLIPYFILVVLQPDLGGAMVLFGIWFAMLLAARLPKSLIFGLIFLILCGALFIWFFVLYDYQKARILSFLNLSQGALDHNYNVKQALIAIGSGGFLGKGFGQGTQSQLLFLPEPHTDFIFSVLAEEWGFLGVFLLLFLLALFFWRFVWPAKLLKDNFSLYFLTGAFWLLALETIINIGMNLKILPIAGLTLPFISYGGSSLLAKFFLLGLIQSLREYSLSQAT